MKCKLITNHFGNEMQIDLETSKLNTDRLFPKRAEW